VTNTHVLIGLAVLAALAVAAIVVVRLLHRRSLTAFSGGDSSPSNNTMDASIWRIGPIVDGVNQSAGMPERPTAGNGGWYFDFPVSTCPPSAHVHYVTHNHGSLKGAKQVRMRYRIEGAGHIYPKTAPPPSPALLTLYFQRRGDDWSAKGEFETYRWYATFATKEGLEPGEFEMVAPLDANWTALISSSRASDPAAFEAAVNDAQALGFVLGGGDGYGHGVYADGPVRFVMLEFVVE
jgi:hypothetical protein